ncbi:hypothetical protein Tco_0494313 [Tanacetum coccineum]
MEYCITRIVNVQSVIDKCDGPLTLTTAKIMESIKKEAHLLKVKWNRGTSLLDNGFEWTGRTTPISLGKYLLLVDYMEGNILSQSRPKKKRKRSKLEDEPFVKDCKVSKKGRTITCQSCRNIGHNKATCKGQDQKSTKGIYLQRTPHLTHSLVSSYKPAKRETENGFPAQSVRSSNAIALDSLYLLVLITGASQSRQHVDTSLIHIESRKPPTKSLFDVDSSRISIVIVNTKEHHSDVLAVSQG